MTDLNDTYPYLTEVRGNESNGQVHLKNVAIRWLLGRGFEIGDIEVEHAVGGGTGKGSASYTDVYGSSDGIEVFVECETNFTETARGLSCGGKIPARNGEAVYVVTDQDIYRVQLETTTIGDSNETPHTYLEFEPIAAPPLLPV